MIEHTVSKDTESSGNEAPLKLFRCYPRIPGARRGKPGHWSYVPSPQLHGRWDNTELYDSWYFSRSAVGALAESFYNKRQWIPEVFLTPQNEPRVIAEFTFDGELLDLDSAETLMAIGIRPSAVVVQDLGVTQGIARHIYENKIAGNGPPDAEREPRGLTWWSSQMPSETSVVLWGHDGAVPAGLTFVGIQPLSIEHPAVIEAASRLYRILG